jgi:tRNA (cmo5U34)-methyltransferase
MAEIDNPFLASCRDPVAVANYRDGPPRFMPGFLDVHRMATVLLSEHFGTAGRIRVLGAGGGLGIQTMGQLKPGWRFEMLTLAADTVSHMADRVTLTENYIDAAPDEPFDGAVCLLTLHFLNAEERVRTVREICRRLRPGAPFVIAHSSFPQEADQRALWLNRYEAFAVASGVDPEIAGRTRQAVDRSMDLLSPEAGAALLNQAGFDGVTPFYRASAGPAGSLMRPTPRRSPLSRTSNKALT